MFKDKLEFFYTKHYKKLIFIPLIILILAFISLGMHNANTGDFFNKDVTLKGGLTASIYTEKDINIEQLELAMPVDSHIRKLADSTTGKNLGITIEVADLTSVELESFLEDYLSITLSENNFSVEETGASLGESFYQDLVKALIFAFVFMGIVVLITFRSFVPSLAIIQAAISDVVITLAIVNFLGFQLSTAGIVAFLLVLGYSIDTDILMTTRVLKRKQGKVFDRLYGAAKTGLTMTMTTVAALGVGSIFATSLVLKQMFIIILIALIVDIFTTYLTNAGMLMWYADKKWKQKKYSNHGE